MLNNPYNLNIRLCMWFIIFYGISKFKIKKTDSSAAISFTKDAIRIVEVTSTIESEIPNDFFDFKFTNSIKRINHIQSLIFTL